MKRPRCPKVLLALMLLITGCRRHESIFATPPTEVIRPPLPIFINRLAIFPVGVLGGGMARGIVGLTLPAPTGGVVVRLAATGGPVSITDAVTIPAGAQTAEFAVTAPAVARDVDVTILASGADSTKTTTFGLWAPVDNYFIWRYEPEIEGVASSGRFVRPTARFDAACMSDLVSLRISSDAESRWDLGFSAGAGVPMVPGSYDGRIGPGWAQVFAIQGCSIPPGNGSFVVTEANLAADGMVREFAARFEGNCVDSSTRLIGEVRVSNPGRLLAGGSCSR
ncbi:MAG: hypothetical protein AB7I13_07875 [Vicinamibacterales bacterium]